MSAGIYDRRTSRLSMGSTASGSRRHSLLSTDGLDNAYSYTEAWGAASSDRLSRWRQAYVAGDTGDAEGVQSTSLALPDESRFTTCVAMSDDQPLLAVGSGSHETNMFFVQSLDDQLDVKASFASKFPIYSLAFKANLLMAGTDRNTSVLYHVDRARLLGFSSESGDEGPLVKCVGTYKNKAAKSIDVAAPGNHVPTRRISCVEFAPPFSGSSVGGWPPAAVGANADVFLSCLGGVINVWDAASSAHALRAEKVSAQPLARACWSPLAPANLIAAAGADGTVSVLDLRRRGKTVAWRTATPEAAGYGAWLHGGSGAPGSGAVNDVAWSPFVPYWLATAGEDGCVSLWDLRYSAADGSPAALLQHPTSHGSMRSLAWSATHADLLATGSSDKAWWLHALRSDNTVGERRTNSNVRGLVVAEKRAADDIGSVVAVRSKGSTFFTLSSCGDLYAHRVTPAALQQAAVHRMQDADFERAESAVYARDIRGAAEAVLGLVERLRDENAAAAAAQQQQQQSPGADSSTADVLDHPVMQHADSIRSLCSLFKVRPRQTHGSWTLADQPSASLQGSEAAQAAFAEDLAMVGYGLPPDFPLEATASRQPLVWQALERLNMSNLRIKLANIVAQTQESDGMQAKDAASTPSSDPKLLWKSVVESERQIVQYVRAEPTLFDVRLLRSIVKLVLPHDCIAGLRLGLGICEAYLENQNSSPMPLPPSLSCEALDGLVHVLLFPTVFDTDSASASSSADGGSDENALAARPVLVPDVQLVRERISECLRACPDVVFEMVRLEIHIQETVLKGGEQAQVAEAIVSLMKAHAQTVGKLLDQQGARSQRTAIQMHPAYPTTTTMSASAVRLYLNSLVPMRAYDEYLVNTQWWRVAVTQDSASRGHVVGDDIGWLSSFPLARTLNRQTASLVVPRFRRQIDVVRSTIQKEPLSLEPRLYRDTLLKVARVNLLMRCDQPIQVALSPPAGSGSTSVAPELLSEVFDEVGHAFLMLLEALTRHSSHRDAYKRAAAEALPLYETLGELLETERVRRPHQQSNRQSGKYRDIDWLRVDERKACMSAISKYLRKLETYAVVTTGQQ
ncbi:hypothetical protein GGI07_003391 [Coemansia sp. Benny D115]|nr:hypothetical protein GGI07_003391 [Coemansia sp. Benny D115]